MKNILITSALALAVCVAVVASRTAAAPQDEPVPAAAAEGLSALSAMTFSCPRAGLNAAAGQAARVPSQGTYQFAYFKIINDGHHAAYEVHFRSNYEGEKDLKYCVEMYCQQGWDPKTTKTSVTLMSAQRAGVNAHGAACGAHQVPASRRVK
jgi:hypothetical protein